MNYLKKVGKSFIYVMIIILSLTLIFTFFNYIGVFGNKLMAISKIIIPIIAFFIGGYIIGKTSSKRGWLEGVKFSLILIVLIMLFKYLGLGNKIIFKDFIYYLILIISSVFGSMIGINKKSEKK